MTPEQFVYWLQGFMELSNTKNLTELQVQQIKDHLNLVFRKDTPDYSKIEDEKPFRYDFHSGTGVKPFENIILC